MNEQDYPPLPAGVLVGSATYLLMKMWVNADRAQKSARHREELLAYEVTVGNLRAACDKFSEAELLQREQAQPSKQVLENIDEVMTQAQVMASAWSLVGSRFDSGSAMQDFEEAKQELRDMLSAAQQAQPERKPTTYYQCVELFRKVQRGMGFKDQDVIPFTSGIAAGEHFHGIKETP